MNRSPFIATPFALLFSFQFQAATAATENVVYSFCSQQNCTDGANPLGGALIADARGNLYGTTYAGGTGRGLGTVFKIAPDGTEAVLHAFQGADGCFPWGTLAKIRRTLYGTTSGCGIYEDYGGTAFSVDLATGAETVLHSFGNRGDGYTPWSGLINVGGTLYGTTQAGGWGYYRGGTVFSLNPATGAETVLHSFGGPGNGLGLYTGLINVKGTLYGTTEKGGLGYGGTVFSLDRVCPRIRCSTVAAQHYGIEKIIHSFGSALHSGVDGDSPEASLLNVKGVLYGTTMEGGSYNRGTVFSINRESRIERVLYGFGGPGIGDGAAPYASLINVGGILYGTTSQGGANSDTMCPYGCGTVFSLDPASGRETVVYNFCSSQSCADGENPQGGLIYLDGALYGTTAGGGNPFSYAGGGTVFRIKL